MRDTLLTSGSSGLLGIDLYNKECEFELSRDLKTVYFQKVAPSTHLSRVKLQLVNRITCEPIANLDMPCAPGGRQDSIRIDSLFALILKSGDRFLGLCTTDTTYSQAPSANCDFVLTITLFFGGALAVPAVVALPSGVMKVGAGAVRVSKEPLAVASHFFRTLFYGDFAEAKADSYAIGGDVLEEDFRSFVTAITTRNWTIRSVDEAISHLELADRYCMSMEVHKCVLPGLRKAYHRSPPWRQRSTLIRLIQLASRCTNNEQFMDWILTRCSTSGELHDLVTASEECMSKESLMAAWEIMGQMQSSEHKAHQTLKTRLATEREERRAERSENKRKKDEWRYERQIMLGKMATVGRECARLKTEVEACALRLQAWAAERREREEALRGEVKTLKRQLKETKKAGEKRESKRAKRTKREESPSSPSSQSEEDSEEEHMSDFIVSDEEED